LNSVKVRGLFEKKAKQFVKLLRLLIFCVFGGAVRVSATCDCAWKQKTKLRSLFAEDFLVRVEA
jgi:hypothetical protein